MKELRFIVFHQQDGNKTLAVFQKPDVSAYIDLSPEEAQQLCEMLRPRFRQFKPGEGCFSCNLSGEELKNLKEFCGRRMKEAGDSEEDTLTLYI